MSNDPFPHASVPFLPCATITAYADCSGGVNAMSYYAFNRIVKDCSQLSQGGSMTWSNLYVDSLNNLTSTQTYYASDDCSGTPTGIYESIIGEYGCADNGDYLTYLEASSFPFANGSLPALVGGPATCYQALWPPSDFSVPLGMLSDLHHVNVLPRLMTAFMVSLSLPSRMCMGQSIFVSSVAPSIAIPS